MKNIIGIVLLLILFMSWQLFIIKKYYLEYSSVKINNKHSEIIIDKNHINFNDIKAIRIVTSEKQPSILERAFSKGAFHADLTDIELYLKNGIIIPFKCNSNKTVNKIISELTPFVETISDERREDKEKIKAVLVASIAIITAIIIVFLTVTKSH